jgi:hypothetical protein
MGDYAILDKRPVDESQRDAADLVNSANIPGITITESFGIFGVRVSAEEKLVKELITKLGTDFAVLERGAIWDGAIRTPQYPRAADAALRPGRH